VLNTTSRDLDLRKGAISKSISGAAGRELQAECESKYPNGIRQGQVIATSGYQLPCKKVYHGSLQKWDQGAGDSEKVCNCLLLLLNYYCYYYYYYPRMPIGKVWIYRLLFVFVCLCVFVRIRISPQRIELAASNFA